MTKALTLGSVTKAERPGCHHPWRRGSTEGRLTWMQGRVSRRLKGSEQTCMSAERLISAPVSSLPLT